MAKTYQPYDPKQALILPPSLDDWLPNEHLARFVSDTIDAIDLSPIYAHYEREERGYPPYHPAMMTKLLVYGYCVNIRSSRKVEQACVDHVAFRWLAAGAQPKHSAINDYRATHIQRLDHLFAQILELAQGAGLVKLATVALDGTKVKANASLAKNRTLAQLDEEHERLRKQARKFLEESQAVDEAEDELYGKDTNPYFLPDGLRTKKERMQRIRKAMEQLERERDEAQREYEKHIEERKAKEERTGKKLRGRKPKPPEPEPKSKRNTTDPESRIMTTRNEGYVQAYNAQAAVDTDSGLIVAGHVTQDANDQHQQAPMLDEIHAKTGRLPQRLVEDAGYWNETEVEATPDGVEVYVATTQDWKRRKALRDQGPPRGRIAKDATLKDRMERKLRTKNGRAVYKLRGQTVEPAFGRIKEDQGVRRFLLRGLAKVQGEWDLVTTAHNVKRLWRLGVPV